MSSSFTQVGYSDVYKGHMKILDGLRNKQPNKCHHVLFELYDAVSYVLYVSEWYSSTHLYF
jgi:hypothetical protein